MSLESLFETPAYALPQPKKERAMLQELNALTARHTERCPEYGKVVRALFPSLSEAAAAKQISDVPYIPIGLFKSHRLVSVPDAEIFRTLASSGTSGQQPSRIFLDRETAELQSRALVHTMSAVLGSQRLPMLIIDAENLLRGEKRFTRARGRHPRDDEFRP